MTPHEARKVRFRRPSVRAACALALVLLAPAAAGLPQSPCQAQWEPTFGVSPDLVYETRVLTVLDDGNGPALYAGGPIESAGGVPANGIAKWDGTRWSALGSGVGVGEVKAVAVYDDGSGPAIYVAGTFASAGGLSASNIAKWDGASWSALGSGTDGVVHALCVYDDGSGPALYAGGEFSTAGGVFSPRIARWNGATWSALGSGISPTIGTLVRSLQVFDDGAGLALFVGGVFFHAGGLSTNYVARWNGAWAALGTGTNGQVLSMLVFDDGSGTGLCLSGAFTVARGSRCIGIVPLTAAGWTTLGSIPTSGVASALAVYDQGTGQSLYAVTGDMFGPKVTRWDGSSWSLLPISVGLGILGQSPAISALASFHVGGQQVLFFGGKFFDAGSLRVRALATWDGAQVGTVGPGLAGYVAALASFDDGSGPALVAGGGFFSVGGTPMAGVAKWDGAHWAPFGSGLGYTSGL